MKRQSKFFGEFKKFILRGNVMDMAVGVIVGGAFTSIVTSLNADILTPILGIFGGTDFSYLTVTLGTGENAPVLHYGNFITAVINFLITALVIFIMLKVINRITEKLSTLAGMEEEKPEPATKKCPFCYSEIDIRATRCPHCTSVLDEQEQNNNTIGRARAIMEVTSFSKSGEHEIRNRKEENHMDENTKKRLDQQFAFIREIDREKFIGRQTYLSDGRRKENDAEHAWHMAIMTMLLSEYANEPIDVLHTIGMLLIHDLVEIDAGDTYAYDEEGKKTQADREKKAADRIYGLLPEEQGKMLYDLWLEFEAQKTPEAKFARVMDNLQPMMLNAATDGKAWVEHGVHLAQIMKRNEHTAEYSETLMEYAREMFIQPNLDNGHIIEDEKK